MAQAGRARQPFLGRLVGTAGRRFVALATGFYFLLLAVFLGVAVLLLRGEAIDAGQRALRAFAMLTAEQTARTLQGVDQVLLLARAALADSPDPNPAADLAVHAKLGVLLTDRPFLRSLWLLDAEGRIVFNSSGRYLGDDVADRPFFTHHRDDPAAEFAIHVPVKSRATGQWYMTLTRPWRHADGSLAGVIVATPERSYFEATWSPEEIGDASSVALFHRDGVLLLRSPYQEEAMGRRFDQSPLFAELLPESPQGTFQNTSVVDGLQRLLAYRTLSAYPELVIVVGQPLEQVLAPWRRHVTIASGIWLAGAVTALAGMGMMSRWLGASEDRLASARQLNQRIFETTVDLILVSDSRGNLYEVSPSVQSILGYRPEEMVGRNAIDFIYPPDLEVTRAQMRSGRRDRAIRRFDTRYQHKDGHIVLLSWAGTWSEAAQRHFFTGRDMTERHAIEEQLRQSQKMEAVGQLTGGVAHDFNNLLTVIVGNADSLVHALEDEPELQGLAEMTANAALRGAELTHSLLAFARKQPLEPRVIDINALVSEMEPLLRRTLGENVSIDMRRSPDLSASLIDPAQLEVALLNLVVNARDAMPEGGRLIIETANVELEEDYAWQNPGLKPGFYVLLSVADSGSGMPPEIVARAFDPFFTTKEIGKGTGLGLSMVYGFVKQSNGHIKVYSEAGHGTTMKLYLPRVAGSGVRVSGRSPVPEVRGGSETVLVVEDDAGVREYVERQLRSLGYGVHCARDGEEALALLQQLDQVDLLFTDVVIPGPLNGPRLAEAARRLRPGLKVVFTSGYAENAIVHQARLDAGVDLLNKPYRRQDLAAKLRKVLDQPAPP